MKTIQSFLTAVLSVALFLAGIAFFLPNQYAAARPSAAQPAAAPLSASACDTTRSVQVSGTAVVNVTPDRALIELGVQSNGATPKEVELLNTRATQSVIQAIHKLGIEDKDIATDWYVIEPLYDDYDSLYIKGYRIHNLVAITLRDVSKTSQVISAALSAGANQVVNVDLYTSELRKYRDQARDMAVTAAREKAQALAKAAGAQAGCVLSINENSWYAYNGSWYGRNSNANQWTQNAVQNITPSSSTGSLDADEPIQLGTIAIKAEITASFSLSD